MSYPSAEPIGGAARLAHGVGVPVYPEPVVSIIMGRVSTEDGDRILETLAALEAQEEAPPYEVLIADRLGDHVSAAIAQRYPATILIPCASGTPLPEMRACGLHQAKGAYVAVTEDHCVPSPRWLKTIVDAFAAAPEDVVAVGGPIENGVHENSFDWATFLCEYAAWLPPLPPGASTALPGMNVAYRREAFRAIGGDRLAAGFWETTAHPEMLRNGGRFLVFDDMLMMHKKNFSLRLFARQRFIYSRYYASLRFERREIGHRALMCVASIALPALVLYRIGRATAQKKRTTEFVRASPWLALFALIWAAGEMVGYVAGSGGALAEIE